MALPTTSRGWYGLGALLGILWGLLFHPVELGCLFVIVLVATLLGLTFVVVFVSVMWQWVILATLFFFSFYLAKRRWPRRPAPPSPPITSRSPAALHPPLPSPAPAIPDEPASDAPAAGTPFGL